MAGLGACATERTATTTAGAASAAFSARSLADPGLARDLSAHGQSPQAGPWRLETLTLAAYYFSPDLAQARAEWASAQGVRTKASAWNNPLLTLTPGYDTTPQGTPPWILAAALDVLVETGGKRHLRIAEADRLLDAAAYHAAAVAWQVRSQVRLHLVEWAAARRRADLLTDQAQAASAALSLMQGLNRAGAVTTYEVVQSQAEFERIQADLRDERRQVDTSRVALGAAIGLPPGALDGVDLDVADFTVLPPATADRTARAAAVANRADLLEAVSRYNASAKALDLQLAQRLPDLHLAPGYQLNLADHEWTLAASGPLPLFDQNQGPIAQAVGQHRAAAARIDALQATVLAQAETAAARYRAALEKLAAAEAVRDAQQKQYGVAETLLARGEISRLDLSQRKLALSAARLAADAQRAEAEQALGALDDALQMPAAVASDVLNTPAFATEVRR